MFATQSKRAVLLIPCVHCTAQGEYTLLESAAVLMQERRAPALIYRRVPADLAGAALSAARAQAAVLVQVGLARLAVVCGVLASAGCAPALVARRGSPGRFAGASKPPRACSGRGAGVVREEADGCGTGAGTGRGARACAAGSQRAPSRPQLCTSPPLPTLRACRRGSALGPPSTAHRRSKGPRRRPSRAPRNRRAAAGPSVTRCVP